MITTTLKYFEIPHGDYGIAGRIYHPKDLIEEVNKYANENNLEIVSISTYENKGLYIAFKKRNNI